MTHRLLAAVLASLAALFLAVGRTQSLSAAAFRPAQQPAVDRDIQWGSVGSSGKTTEVAWPSRVPARLLEVVYVYTNRERVTGSGGSQPLRRDRQES